jgi:hypothetical protein
MNFQHIFYFFYFDINQPLILINQPVIVMADLLCAEEIDLIKLNLN